MVALAVVLFADVIFLGGLGIKRDAGGVGRSLPSLCFRSTVCWDFLAVGLFYEGKMVESWESCAFAVPEIVCTRSTPFSFNVEVALKRLCATWIHH